MPLLLQRWDCIFSTTEVLGRTTYIAPLLAAEVCKLEHLPACETGLCTFTGSKGQSSQNLFSLAPVVLWFDERFPHLVRSVVISCFRWNKIHFRHTVRGGFTWSVFILLATWWLILSLYLMVFDKTIPCHPLANKPHDSPCHTLLNMPLSAATPKPDYNMVCICYSRNILTATWWQK